MDLYWIGGSGNWSDTAHWATTDGGAGPHAAPTAADNAHFTLLSNLTAYTVTVDASSTCLDLKFDAAPAVGTITWAGSAALAISGSMLLLNGMTRTYTGAITFNATAIGKTLTFNSVSLASNLTFDSTTGGWVLQDTLTTTGSLFLSNTASAGLDTNGVAVNTSGFSSNVTGGVRTLTLGATIWNISAGGGWVFNQGTHTLNAGTSQIIFTNPGSPAMFLGTHTYYDVTIQCVGASNATSLTITTANTFHNLTITNNNTETFRAQTISLNGNQIVTGTFTVTGASATKHTRIISDTAGTPRTITAAAVSLTDANFKDITGAGAATWSGTRLGDELGNSGITLPVGAKFWVGGSGNVSDPTNHWATTSGGSPGVNNYPCPQDSVTTNGSSNPTAYTITVDIGFACGDITFGAPGTSGTVTLVGASVWTIYGSVVMLTGMANTMSGAITFNANTAKTITPNGVSLSNLTFDGTGGSWTLQSALVLSLGSSPALLVSSGTFNANNFNVTTAARVTASAGATLAMGSGTWTNSGTSLIFNISTTATVTGSPSIIVSDTSATVKSLDFGGLTYGSLTLPAAGIGSYNFTGSVVLTTLTVGAGSIVRVTTGKTITAATWTLNGRSSATTDARSGLLFIESGCYFSTPDSVAASVTGDLDLRGLVAYDSWTTNQQVIAKWSDSETAYYLDVGSDGSIGLGVHPSGIAALRVQSTLSTGFTAGSLHWIRATLTANNGAGGWDAKFYTAVDTNGTPGAWTQLGATVTTATAITITDTAGNVQVGGRNTSGAGALGGKVYRAQVYNGIAGSLVVDFDPKRWSSGSTFTASTGEVWTRNGTAQFTGDNMVTFAGVTDAGYTLAQSGSAQDWKYVSSRNATVTAAKVTAHYSMDGGSNTNWTFTAARYWVGGTGNWSSTAQWSLSSGGASGAAVPTATEDVEFDNQSNATAYTATVDATANCNRLSFGAAPATSGTITFAGSANLNIAGSMIMLTGMTRTYTGGVTWQTTSVATVTSNGVVFSGIFQVQKTSGSITLADAFSNTGNKISLQSGTFNSGGFSITSGMESTGSTTRAANLAGSAVDVSGFSNGWIFSAVTGLTFVAPASINFGGGTFSGGGLSYNDVTIAQGTPAAVTGANTYVNFTSGQATSATRSLTFDSNQIITGTFTASGNSATNRTWIKSDTLGTPRTITAAAVSLSNVDFVDIVGAGAAAPWTGTSLGDALGNSGITFTPAATQYWKTTTSGTKNWETAGNWFLGTNGTGGAGRVPLPQDDVVFDASSIGAASTIVSVSVFRIGKNINWTGVTNSPAFTLGGPFNTYFFGSLTLGAGMTAPGQVWGWMGRSACTLDTAGVTLAGGLNDISGFGGSLTLQSALTISDVSRSVVISAGTFDTNGKSCTFAARLTLGGGVLSLGASLITMTGSGVFWNVVGGTLNAGTSTIKVTDATATTKIFVGGGKTYNNIWLSGAGAGAYEFRGSNTFNDFRVDNLPKDVQFTAGTTTTVASVTKPVPTLPGDTKFARLPGATPSYFSTPDSAAASITGDLAIIWYGALNDWTPSANNDLVAKFLQTGNQESYVFSMLLTGRLQLTWSANGSSIIQKQSTTNPVVSDLGLLYVAVTLDVDNGAAGNDVKFFTSPDGIVWTQLGTTVTTAGTTSIFDSTSEVQISNFNSAGGNQPTAGDVYRAQIFNGIPTILSGAASNSPVVDFNPGDWSVGNTWVSATGETWTRTGNALLYPEMRIHSVTASVHTLTKTGGGQVQLDYMNIDHSTATPGNTWVAGAANHSTDGGSNTGWFFTTLLDTPDTGALTLSGVGGSMDLGITPQKGAMTLTGGPAVHFDYGIYPPTGHVDTAGYSVAQNLGTTPSPGTLTVAGLGSSMDLGMTPQQGSIAITGVGARLDLGMYPASGQITNDGYSVSQDLGMTPARGSITVAGNVPVLIDGLGVYPGAGGLTFTGYADPPIYENTRYFYNARVDRTTWQAKR